MRVGQSVVEVLGADEAPASVLVHVRGIEDLPVIIAAVAAVVGAAWLAACGVSLGTCVNRCGEEFEVRCDFLDVDVDFPHVSVGGSFSFSCKCR